MLQLQSKASVERLKTMSGRGSRNTPRNGGPVRALAAAHGASTRSIDSALYEPDEIIRQTELRPNGQQPSSTQMGAYQYPVLKPCRNSLIMRQASGLIDCDPERQTITLKKLGKTAESTASKGSPGARKPKHWAGRNDLGTKDQQQNEVHAKAAEV